VLCKFTIIKPASLGRRLDHPRRPEFPRPFDLWSCGPDLLNQISSEAAPRASPYLIRLFHRFLSDSPASPPNPQKQIYTPRAGPWSTQLPLLFPESSRRPLLSLPIALSFTSRVAPSPTRRPPLPLPPSLLPSSPRAIAGGARRHPRAARAAAGASLYPCRTPAHSPPKP